jgi:hypothetical protein
MPKWKGFVGGTGVAQALSGAVEDTVNLYVERLPDDAANEAALLPTPGFQRWGSATTDVGTRAMVSIANNRLFAIIGAGLWEFDINGAGTRRGTVALDANPAQLAYNGVIGGQMGIASGGNIYAYDLTTNTLTGPYLNGGYTHIAYASGFGLAFNATTGKVNLSNLNNLTVWSAAQFFQRSLFADPWRAMFVDQNNLIWLIGTDSFEVWYNTGQGTQPWAPLSGLVGVIGIVGPFAYAVAQAGNVWLARNQAGQGLLVMTHGGPPESLSSRAMASAVTTYSRNGGLADTEIVHHQTDAHLFTNITFPRGGTWSYDSVEQSWTRRGKWNPATGSYAIWQPRCHGMAFGKHLVGDRTTGVIAEMDASFATELDGTGIRRLRRTPALLSEKRRAPIDQLELLMDVGLGVQSGQGAPPTVLLRVSDDGGRTWSNELRASTGAAGAWRTRVYWTRLGLFQHAVAEFTYSDPVPFRVVDAYLNNLEAA